MAPAWRSPSAAISSAGTCGFPFFELECTRESTDHELTVGTPDGGE